MYRTLDENLAVRERRNQLHHPNYIKPELLAKNPTKYGAGTSPNTFFIVTPLREKMFPRIKRAVNSLKKSKCLVKNRQVFFDSGTSFSFLPISNIII
jgi:hypothetical protein